MLVRFFAGGIELYGITRSGERIEGPCFTGIELAAVILTRDDDKPGLIDALTADVFPRMSGANPRELLSQSVRLNQFKKGGEPVWKNRNILNSNMD
jgi:hypothetical protein